MPWDDIERNYSRINREVVVAWLNVKFRAKLEAELARFRRTSRAVEAGLVKTSSRPDVDEDARDANEPAEANEQEKEPPEGAPEEDAAEAVEEEKEDDDASSDAKASDFEEEEEDAPVVDENAGDDEPAAAEPAAGDADGGDRRQDETNKIFPSKGTVHGDKFVLKSRELPLNSEAGSRVLLLEVLHNVTEEMYVQETPKIKSVNIVEQKDDATGETDTCLQFEGDNLEAVWMLSWEKVDFNRLRTNDIHLMLVNYGVEAARAAIVGSIRDVFCHYGITVDFRHLYLIADYMTKDGGFRPFNRAGLSYMASPWLQMTFETSMSFITQASTQLLRDELQSPAASIIVGNMPTVGTGAFDIVQDLNATFDRSSQAPLRQFSMPTHGKTWDDADPLPTESRKRPKTFESPANIG